MFVCLAELVLNLILLLLGNFVLSKDLLVLVQQRLVLKLVLPRLFVHLLYFLLQEQVLLPDLTDLSRFTQVIVHLGIKLCNNLVESLNLGLSGNPFVPHVGDLVG